MKRTALLALPLAALFVVACGTPSEGSSPNPEGTWGADAPNAPQLILAEDGSLSVTDGCNRLVGTWELHDDRVEFSPIAFTNMFCEGVDAWLSQAAIATAQDDTLRIFDHSGEEIGSLVRQSS